MSKLIPFLSILFFMQLLHAQTGNIQGIIIDNDGIVLSGATILIKDLSKGTVSDLNGRFTITGIREGNYILQVSYLGLSNMEQQVLVKSSQTVFLTFILQPEEILLKGVEVVHYGIIGQAIALNTQKNNLNITNIISTDQIGKFPDANIGDALKRIPGITIQVDKGEARDLIIRGLSPELNSVTLNGSRIPSAEGDKRNIQMDLIPSDMIQTVEVTKTLTPDMEADALGGSVNLITRTSPQGFRLSATFGSGISFITDKLIWNGSLLVGNRSKDDKFGFMVSASINDRDFGSDGIEAQWSDTFEYNTGINDEEGNPELQELDVNPYSQLLEQQSFVVERVRRSFAANFDYQINGSNTIFLKTMYNWRDEREDRVIFEQEILAPELIEVGDFTIIENELSRFPVLVSRQTRGGNNSKRNKNARLEDQRMQNYSLGGDHLLGKLKLDWMTSYSKASEEINNERTAEFKSTYTILNDFSSLRYPFFIPVNTEDPNDLENFLYDEIIEENKYTEEEDLNILANVEIPSDLFDRGYGLFKFGLRGRLKSKLRNNNFFEFDLENEYPTLADTPTNDFSDPGFLVGSQYQIGEFPDEEWLGNLVLQNGTSVPQEFLKQNYTVTENVYAAYLMSSQKISEKLNVLVGIRAEYTDFKATANKIENGAEVVATTSAKDSYTNILPGVHFKYTLNESTIFRFAWTNTLARPNYVDMVPSLDIVYNDEEIFLGNPQLNPTTSMNFDLIGEHYFKTIGIVSVGAYFKQIKDFIYTFRSKTTDDIYGPGTTGFEIFQPLNGEGASLFGVEVAFQRQLDFLPGFARNFNLAINYTYLTSSTRGIRDVSGIEREDLDLPNTSPNLFNASLGYESKKFTARLSTNFSGAHLTQIGSRSFQDIYYDNQFFLDFNIAYVFKKNLRFYCGINNINNQALRLYQGVPDRSTQVELYGRQLTFGIKYDLFKH